MVRRAKKVITSYYYEEHLLEILEYGIEMFGYLQVKRQFCGKCARYKEKSIIERVNAETSKLSFWK